MTKLRARANNYRRTHRSFRKEQKLSNKVCHQTHFHGQYLKSDHYGICDWEIRIIDNAQTEKSLRQKELYRHHILKVYTPFDLNERDAYAGYWTRRSLHGFDVISIIIF